MKIFALAEDDGVRQELTTQPTGLTKTAAITGLARSNPE